MKQKDEKLKLLFQELNENPYKRLNIAFILISIIPLLAVLYVLCDSILIGKLNLADISPIFIIAGVIVLLGYAFGYTVIQGIINKTLNYAVKAKRADEFKSMFAMSLAHDLKSPLSTIKTNVSSMRTGLRGDLSEEQKEVVRVCDEVADRMGSMILELLETYMIEARAVKVNISRFDLRDVVGAQMRELETIASAKKIKIDTDISKKPLMLEADREKIIRVINNLLSNSIKYTPDSGRISVRAHSASGFIRMEFMNSGAPIPADRLDKIFDKFERLDNLQEGHGLGLAIAKDIVELHKGRIWATSEPGKPNCFIVLLSMAGETTRAADKKTSKVLVVEDDKHLAFSLKSFLIKQGYDVVVANDAQTGIESSRAKDIGLVILDLGLPGVDDFFVLQNLRRLPETAKLPIIVVTANVAEGIEDKVRSMGANDFVRKPYDLVELLDRARVFLA